METKNKSPSNFIDMTGWVMSEHGVPESRLTVIEKVKDKTKGRARWLVECSCINKTRFEADGKSIRNGNTTSCGCLQKEKTRIMGLANKGVNDIRIEGEVVIGFTSNTHKEFYVDLKNLDKIKKYCWYEKKNGNMSRLLAKDTETGKTISMHGLLGFKHCDHEDRNELNNLEDNLRPASCSQNSMNRTLRCDNKSGVIGVYWDETQNRWYAYLNKNGKRVLSQYFINRTEAIKARLNAEVKYFGEFAPQKHLYEQYDINTTTIKE